MTKRQIYLQRQRFTVSGAKGIEVEFELSEDKIIIFNERGGTDFVFKNGNTKNVLTYWQEVLKCMDIAVSFALKELDKPRAVGLLSKNRKGPAQAKTQAGRGHKAKAQNSR